MTRITMLLLIGLFTFAAAAEEASLETPSVQSIGGADARLSFEFDPTDVSLAAVSNGDPFAKGSWVWQTYGAGSFGDNEGDLYSGYFGVGYYFKDDLSVSLDGLVMWADADKGDDVVGGGLDLIFRWHFYHHGKWSIFGDVGGGVVWFDDEFPPGGTSFNFTVHAGVGATYQFENEMMLLMGVRWFHLSNARIKGRDRNIGYDGLSLYLGVMKPF